jgi:hypothetical protein
MVADLDAKEGGRPGLFMELRKVLVGDEAGRDMPAGECERLD